MLFGSRLTAARWIPKKPTEVLNTKIQNPIDPDRFEDCNLFYRAQPTGPIGMFLSKHIRKRMAYLTPISEDY